MFSLQRRNHNLRAHGSLRKRIGTTQCRSLPSRSKKACSLTCRTIYKIAGWPAKRARFAETGETNSRAVLHSRGHLSLDHALAQASGLRLLHFGQGSVITLPAPWQCRAGSSDAEEALLIPHWTAPIARPAGTEALPGAAPFPRQASQVSWRRTFTCLSVPKTASSIRDCRSSRRSGSALGAAAATSRPGRTSRQNQKCPRKCRRSPGRWRDRIRLDLRCCRPRPHARNGHTATALAIREDCVGFRDLLELVFRLRIIRIAVRMIRHREACGKRS